MQDCLEDVSSHHQLPFNYWLYLDFFLLPVVLHKKFNVAIAPAQNGTSIFDSEYQIIAPYLYILWKDNGQILMLLDMKKLL